VLLCNHQSQLDIPALVAALEESTGFVAKKELGKVPLLAWWMRRVGCVFIDRSDKYAARKAMGEVARNMGAHPLAVFPEGTRSKTGTLLPIKFGGLRLAVQARAQIIPVHIRNTRTALEARTASTPKTVPVELRFFPPLDARDLPDEKESWGKVRDYLEACWAEGEQGGDR
jgi:1-acyl-sn-glycerol-3-phosphate acyltransferase